MLTLRDAGLGGINQVKGGGNVGLPVNQTRAIVFGPQMGGSSSGSSKRRSRQRPNDVGPC